MGENFDGIENYSELNKSRLMGSILTPSDCRVMQTCMPAYTSFEQDDTVVYQITYYEPYSSANTFT